MTTTSWEDVTAQIKDRLDIVDVVSQYVILKKKGQHHWGCCPFHKEKTPSFSVNPARGIFKCFGCGESGDVISFTEKYFNLDFRGACEMLGAEYGIDTTGSFGSNENRKEDCVIVRLQFLQPIVIWYCLRPR